MFLYFVPSCRISMPNSLTVFRILIWQIRSPNLGRRWAQRLALKKFYLKNACLINQTCPPAAKCMFAIATFNSSGCCWGCCWCCSWCCAAGCGGCICTWWCCPLLACSCASKWWWCDEEPPNGLLPTLLLLLPLDEPTDELWGWWWCGSLLPKPLPLMWCSGAG